MLAWRSFRQLVTTYWQARRGLPNLRVAFADISSFAMFVAAVAGMVLGLVWLPNDASPTRSFIQPMVMAVVAAVAAYAIITFLYWCFGFGVVVMMADLMAGAFVGLMVTALWAGFCRQSPPDWINWFPLVGAVVGWATGQWIGGGPSRLKTQILKTLIEWTEFDLYFVVST